MSVVYIDRTTAFDHLYSVIYITDPMAYTQSCPFMLMQVLISWFISNILLQPPMNTKLTRHDCGHHSTWWSQLATVDRRCVSCLCLVISDLVTEGNFKLETLGLACLPPRRAERVNRRQNVATCCRIYEAGRRVHCSKWKGGSIRAIEKEKPWRRHEVDDWMLRLFLYRLETS